MSDAGQDAAREQLAALRADYRRRSREQINALAARLGDEAPPIARLVDAEQGLHRLAGSGGTFGFPELSRRARALELETRALRQNDSQASDADLKSLQQRVSALEAALDEESTSTPFMERTADPATQPPRDRDAPIYLIEDDAAVAAEIVAILRQFGHTVRHFETSAALEQAVRDTMPDTLLVDVLLPQESRTGIEVVADLQQRRGLQCEILCISALDDFDQRLAAARIGARGYFVKPVEPVRLVDRIDSLRQRRNARPYRVLLIDDDTQLARHFAAVLMQHGFDVETLANPRTTLERIDGFRPDLVLLDLYMPECSGPELARVIRMREEWLALPIVFLSAETDYDLQLLASSEGADDFLVKPISDSQLVAAVRARCERSAQLAELMFRDSLTGLLKHSRIKEQLLQEVGRAVRHSRALSVAMVDIDHFKHVNDTHGHSVGDQVIRALAQLLRQRVRRIDSIGRYGGEEFLLLLPQCNIADARLLLEDIRQRFFSLRFQGANGPFIVSLSAGIASTETAENAADLLEAADQALYRAKDGGRNQVVLAD